MIQYTDQLSMNLSMLRSLTVPYIWLGYIWSFFFHLMKSLYQYFVVPKHSKWFQYKKVTVIHLASSISVVVYHPIHFFRRYKYEDSILIGLFSLISIITIYPSRVHTTHLPYSNSKIVKNCWLSYLHVSII